jgi:hypothetical protein
MQMRPGHSGSYLIAANRMTPLPDGWSGGVPGDYAREGNPINNLLNAAPDYPNPERPEEPEPPPPQPEEPGPQPPGPEIPPLWPEEPHLPPPDPEPGPRPDPLPAPSGPGYSV